VIQTVVDATSFLPAERPFSSCQGLYRHFGIGKARNLWISENELSLKKLTIFCGLSTLSDNEKCEKVSYSTINVAV
jgi:hypothetical protein